MWQILAHFVGCCLVAIAVLQDIYGTMFGTLPLFLGGIVLLLALIVIVKRSKILAKSTLYMFGSTVLAATFVTAVLPRFLGRDVFEGPASAQDYFAPCFGILLLLQGLCIVVVLACRTLVPLYRKQL